MPPREITIPRSVFVELALGQDEAELGNGPLNDPYCRQEFVKTLRHFMFHTDLKALGIDPDRFAALFGATLAECSWFGANEHPVDDRPEILQKLAAAHLTVAYASRILRSDERLREAFRDASSVEQAIAGMLPQDLPPTLATLIAHSRSLDVGLRISGENPAAVIHGRLDPFSETGTEGVIWSVQDDISLSYDALHPLENGDHLQVFDERGDIIWTGLVDLEFSRLQHRQGKWQQQTINGTLVHGFNASQTPEEWTDMFIKERCARLVKSKPDLRPALTIISGN
jgi:hypothetical protein